MWIFLHVYLMAALVTQIYVHVYAICQFMQVYSVQCAVKFDDQQGYPYKRNCTAGRRYFISS